MGRSHSKFLPIVYPPIDPIFISQGCSGFIPSEISGSKLDNAPFLYRHFTALNYADFMKQLLGVLQNMQKLQGPVYLLCALNIEHGNFDVYVYFPSIQKDGKPLSNYNMLYINHRWMYLLLFSHMFNVKPYSSCFLRKGEPNYSKFGYDSRVHPPDFQHPNKYANNKQLKNYIENKNYADIGSFVLGCSSENGKCIQSQYIHKSMGIYDPKKNENYDRDNPERFGYPVAYYRSYKLNQNDYVEGRTKSKLNTTFNAFVVRIIMN